MYILFHVSICYIHVYSISCVYLLYTCILYFMCLFLEMLWVKKCNLSGGKYFPDAVNIFPMLKIW